MKDTAAKTGKTKEEKGFTLLEVLVAIVLLTVGLLGVAAMQAMAIKGNAFAGGVTEATTLAGDRMEYLMTLPYDDLDVEDTDGDGTAGLDDATAGTADQNRTYNNENGMQYDLYWNTVRNAPTADNTTIKIIVTWKDRGVQRKVSMQSIIAKTS